VPGTNLPRTLNLDQNLEMDTAKSWALWHRHRWRSFAEKPYNDGRRGFLMGSISPSKYREHEGRALAVLCLEQNMRGCQLAP